MWCTFAKNQPIHGEFLKILQQEEGERTFASFYGGFDVFIVLDCITKHEIMEFQGSLSVIYQNLELPMLILKYKRMSFEMPLIPNPTVDEESYGNRLTIYVIDLKGYVVKQIRTLGLDPKLAQTMIHGISTIEGYSKQKIGQLASNLYRNYTSNELLKGGMRQRFEVL